MTPQVTWALTKQRQKPEILLRIRLPWKKKKRPHTEDTRYPDLPLPGRVPDGREPGRLGAVSIHCRPDPGGALLPGGAALPSVGSRLGRPGACAEMSLPATAGEEQMRKPCAARPGRTRKGPWLPGLPGDSCGIVLPHAHAQRLWSGCGPCPTGLGARAAPLAGSSSLW